MAIDDVEGRTCNRTNAHCSSCCKNIKGKDCIEYDSYHRWEAWSWAAAGGLLFLIIQLFEEDRLAAFAKRIENIDIVFIIASICIVLIFFLMIGFVLRLRLSHPYEYAVASFTGPMGLYAAVPIALNAFAG